MAGGNLTRCTDDKMIAGVCCGIARYFGLDAALVRLVWALAIVLGGFGVLVYIVLWIVLPEGSGVTPAIRVAEERFARGEISADELGEIRQTLRG